MDANEIERQVLVAMMIYQKHHQPHYYINIMNTIPDQTVDYYYLNYMKIFLLG